MVSEAAPTISLYERGIFIAQVQRGCMFVVKTVQISIIPTEWVEHRGTKCSDHLILLVVFDIRVAALHSSLASYFYKTLQVYLLSLKKVLMETKKPHPKHKSVTCKNT